MTHARNEGAPTTSLEVRDRFVEALKLELVGPAEGDPLEDERLPPRIRLSNRYLIGFILPLKKEG